MPEKEILTKEKDIVSLNDNENLNNELLRRDNFKLRERVQKLEKRISDIEKSTLWRIKSLYTKIRFVFRSSTSSSEKGRFLRYLKFFFSKHFFRVFRKLLKTVFKYLYLYLEDKPVRIVFLEDLQLLSQKIQSDPYQLWLEKNSPRKSDIQDYLNNITLFQYKPFFSIIVPIYNPPEKFLREMIDSVLNQVYTHWELCLADDNSPNPQVRAIIKEYAEKDPRIKYVFRKENGHISACSNSSLSIATGEFAVLLDHDDMLTSDALYQVANTLNQYPDTDFIYSDEDKLDENNQFKDAHFKPDWCPDNFLSRNYLCHLSTLRMSLVKEIGGFREGFEGSQDYDLFLRFTEKTNRIVHIPKILYHWRLHSESTALNSESKPYAYYAAQKALQEALARRNENGEALFYNSAGTYSIRYEVKGNPKVSIIIPNKNKAKLLKACLNSITSKSTYKNYEIIVIDNGSTESELFGFYKKMKRDFPDLFQYYSLDIPFNFSKLINYGYKKASGDFILLLNNDTEVITEDWIELMIGYAQRKTTGVVGCKLLYSDDTIQHAGVVVGFAGTAGHTFVGNHKDDHGYFNYINSINNYSALTGACIMVKKELFDTVNGFDEEFATEYNDVDFCLRIKELGFNNVYLPQVELYHHESLSRGNVYASKKSYANHLREKKIFTETWAEYIEHDPCYSRHLSLNYSDFRIRI